MNWALGWVGGVGDAWVGPGGRVGDVDDQVHDRRRVGVGLEVTYWRCRTLPAPGGETWAEGPEAALLRLVWFHTVFSLSLCLWWRVCWGADLATRPQGVALLFWLVWTSLA